MQVVVIGAGITGLSAAVELRARGAQVTVLEAADRAGGVISTLRKDGYLVEAGPTSLNASAALEGLIDRLGLGAKRLGPSPAAKRRFIVRDGALVALPTSPLDLVSTRALSASAKLRLLREPFLGATVDDQDESVADLVRRRLGDEILTYLVNPFVAGVYAGDPERLSARHALPLLFHAERRHGSLLVGGMREAKARAGVVRQKGLTSFADGLRTLPDAMAATLGTHLHLRAEVRSIAREGDGWRIQSVENGSPTERYADAVIYAGPAHRLHDLGLPEGIAPLLTPITSMQHPPVATLALGFRRDEVAHALDGFGLLCPAVEQRQVLGVLFSSSVFEGRAPRDHVLLTCFLGGSRSPDMGRLETEQVLPRVLQDLKPLLGLRAAPTFVHHHRWQYAIPQYELGHETVTNCATQVESMLPGVYFAGQWRGGVALGDCITQGQAMAVRVSTER